MIVEIINTGNELMLGRVLNTHQQWLCRQLADHGFIVSRQVAVADTHSEIEQAVRESLSRADLVITTGGLGPTSDDLTRDALARMLGKPMHEDASVLAEIHSFFVRRNRPVPERTQVEAQVPEGAIVLPNHHGTAPGLAIEVSAGMFRAGAKPAWLILLPGPPRELRPMFTDSVVPLLQRVFPSMEAVVCRTLRTTGLGESQVQEQVEGSLQTLVQAGLEVGYCARPGEVDVRLVSRGSQAAAQEIEAESIVRARLGAHVYGDEDETLESVVIRLLSEHKQTLALAESCTGGCISNRLTNIPGASAVIKGAFVTYSNDMKQACLGVNAQTLAQHGAVSEAVAREMAEGARRVSGSDYAIAVTGIAGPSGGTAEKPVGTVFIAVASARSTEVRRMLNPWDRVTFKEVTAQQALNQLRVLIETAS
ncbi:MAG: competence/damage-inducible protein A [Verrucomicrobiota bacterium]